VYSRYLRLPTHAVAVQHLERDRARGGVGLLTAV